MARQNVICADGESICLFCSVGDDLEDGDSCGYDPLHTDEGCPGFECSEQCRLCPSSCEFLDK